MTGDLRLGLMLGYWAAQPRLDDVELAQQAESFGFDSVWTAESWGSDVVSPLAWIGAQTSRIKLGTGVMQLSARTPASAAMTALTLDHLSGGRMILGLGVSGPQVVEGWYGQPFPQPLARTREYVRIIRAILAREHRVTNDGPHYPLPYPGGTGLGKPLRSITHPRRYDVPIVLGAEGPKNVALAAEIADGLLPVFFSPDRMAVFAPSLEAGFKAAGGGKSLARFD
ncbi:MAG TPA: LLM class flavin-dependent oxidoreductase, partial [Nitriliruptorales bacterium]